MVEIKGVGLRDNNKGVIPYLAAEPDEFEVEAKRYMDGEIDDMTFTPWRLRRGVYGQRQPNVQMIRVKVPGGIANGSQLRALADVAEHFAPLNKGHITTRENIQFHHVPLQIVGDAIRVLGEGGLSTREGCGNTVRNVTADPMLGIDPRQAFDLTPYLVAYVRYFVRNPLTQSLPRKWKTAFSSGEHDPAQVPMHDMGLVARVRVIDGVERKGFKIVVGGGTSILPKLAETVTEFVPVEEYLKLAEAMLRVFNQADELRKNRMMARIKVLIHRHGIEHFKKLVDAELEKPWAKEGNFDPTPLMGGMNEHPPKLVPVTDAGKGNKAYELWRKTNVQEQLQKGYFVATAKVPQGDLSPEQFRAIAAIAEKYGAGTVGLSVDQNFAFRWIPEGSLYAVWQELEKLGLGEAEAATITDVTSCPGTDSCKLGITSSMGLNRAMTEEITSWNTQTLDDPLVKKMHVKISGCPNGCGRHHMANIGFHGASIKGASGQQVPAYELFLGGHYDDGKVNYGTRLKTKVPAKLAPTAARQIVEFYRANRNGNEEFNDFVTRVGIGPFDQLLAPHREVGALNKETLPVYMDWGKTVLYKVERGEGECAV